MFTITGIRTQDVANDEIEFARLVYRVQRLFGQGVDDFVESPGLPKRQRALLDDILADIDE